MLTSALLRFKVQSSAPFGLPPASPPLQSPILRYFSLLLDFLLPLLRFKVQSSAPSRSFWTSSCLLSTSKSNPPIFLTPFGLPPASPPPQSPFRRSFSLLLDFLVRLLHLKVHSTALFRSFWTSSCLSSASKSNPPLLLSFWTSSCLPSASRSNPPRSRSPPRKKCGLQSNPPVAIRQF